MGALSTKKDCLTQGDGLFGVSLLKIRPIAMLGHQLILEEPRDLNRHDLTDLRIILLFSATAPP
jgi:hypothetical protein